MINKFICKYCKKNKEIEYFGFSIIDNNELEKKNLITHVLDNSQNLKIQKAIENQICSACYKEIIKEKKEELNRIQNKIRDIDNIIKTIDIQMGKSVFMALLNTNINDLKNENNKVINNFNSLKKIQNELEKQIGIKLNELKKIKNDEKNIWSLFEGIENEIILISKNINLERVNLSINENIQINLLKTNIFNLLFELEVNECYGSINGIKFEYNNNKFKFDEIYCGWGHILFLTVILNYRANKILNINDQHNFKICYCLDYSQINDFQSQNEYKFFSENVNESDKKKIDGLNKSMKFYLKILKIIINKYQKSDNSINYINSDFVIGEDTINNFSISCNISERSDKNWNLCMRNVIIILQILIKSILTWENKQLSTLLEKTKLFQINK
jgi:hypothetical protein